MPITNRIEWIEVETFTDKTFCKNAATFCLYVRLILPEVSDIHLSRLVNVASAIIRQEIEGEKVLLPECYEEYKDVFLEKNTYILPEHALHNHAMELVEGKQPPWGPIYSFLEEKLAVLRAYIEKHLQTRFICLLQSSAGAFILFVKKQRRGFRLCVDYQGFNNITIKNQYLLPLVEESFDRLSWAKHYT